jgi:hypothetical protein
MKNKKTFIFSLLRHARTPPTLDRRLRFAQRSRSNDQGVIFKVHSAEHPKLFDMFR